MSPKEIVMKIPKMKFINTKINMNKACLNVEISMIEKCVENPERLYGIWRESKEEMQNNLVRL